MQLDFYDNYADIQRNLEGVAYWEQRSDGGLWVEFADDREDRDFSDTTLYGGTA